jgi:hypothetical protein
MFKPLALCLGSMVLAGSALAQTQCAPAQPATMPAAAPVPTPAAAVPAPPSPALSAADAIKASGVHEMTPAEIAQIPGLEPVVKAGARIFVIGNGAGVPNLLAVNGHAFQVFAPMGDPRFLCRGVIQDDHGNNVTLAAAAKIPGLVAPPGRPAIEPIATADDAIHALARSAYGTFGPADAPAVWLVVDPLCVHSQQAVKDLMPYAAAGRIRLNIMPVSVISPQSAPAARVLLSEAPDQMLQRWFQPGGLKGNYDISSADKLDRNNRVFAGLTLGMKVAGVPEIFWMSRGVSQAKTGLGTPEVPSFIESLRG